MTDAIPSFFVYGEPEQQLEPGFFHVETVMARRNLHQGQVKAHKHDQMGQITFWMSGRGTYFIDDRPLDFLAPAVSFVPSGIVHGFSVDPETSDAVVVSVADGALLSIRENTTLPVDAPVMIRGDGEDRGWRRLAELLDIVADEYARGAPGTQQMLASLVAAVLTQIARLASATPSPAQPSQAMLAAQLRRLIDLHFRENWSVAQYTDALATTPHLIAKASRTPSACRSRSSSTSVDCSRPSACCSSLYGRWKTSPMRSALPMPPISRASFGYAWARRRATGAARG